ncbi:MAG: aminomethyl-transferring glycine dehydrogenase subunit GcvPB [Candidatus Acetothermia bacterium]|jgi:glycine dehydrogenase subunit 2|nr:aminomethyl-transferring glycine dehydrogenase subunit GcvPB [Candidatus Acetothermia bacterium]
MTTIYDRGAPGRQAAALPSLTRPEREILAYIPAGLRRRERPRLPEVSQPELVRHYTHLSRLNYGVDTGFYPLGSCTMKHNPKLHEDLARLPAFAGLHPLLPEEEVQGALALLWELGEHLKGIAGMPGITLQPAAGAHGELTGMLLIKRYLEDRGELGRRTKILLPDSAHGTNPASAAMVGFQVVAVPSDGRGMVDMAALRTALGEDVAGIMLTVPNTLGIFEEDILEITRLAHEAGGLCYFDGANLNAYIGRARPGDMGADIFHFNLHKTFSTPHGGGGPGAGPVAVSEALVPYLPVPEIVREGDRFRLRWDKPKSIGRVHPYFGNFLVMVKALAYILTLGDEGFREVSAGAVLAANYLRARLRGTYKVPYDRLCKHEFVLSGEGLPVRTLDIAKRLIDHGFHPPTIYFPLIVKEALMIEPTETEPKEVLDAFCEALVGIAGEARERPELLQRAPHNAPVRRLDEARAVREPVLRLLFDSPQA